MATLRSAGGSRWIGRPLDGDGAVGRRLEAGDHAQRRGLAAARRAQQRHGLARSHGHRQRLDRMHRLAPRAAGRSCPTASRLRASVALMTAPAPLAAPAAAGRWPCRTGGCRRARIAGRPGRRRRPRARLTAARPGFRWPSPVCSSVTQTFVQRRHRHDVGGDAPAAAGPIPIASGRTPSRLARPTAARNAP